MRGVLSVAVACVAASILAACNWTDVNYTRQGIGTELAYPEIPAATELQNIYLDYLCKQALPFVGADAPGCPQERVTAEVWPIIVQAGLNDIDQRCDAFLAWLDQKKRENSAILAEISAIRVAVDAITNPQIPSGVGPRTLASIAAAFGLATSTFQNLNSLLLHVEHTTVQSVVFNRRNDFRAGLSNLPMAKINNKPLAVYTLRSYLTICLPMTIAADINSTVTVVQQAGVPGTPLVPTPIISAPSAPSARDTAGKRNVIREKGLDEAPDIPNIATIILGYSKREFPKSTVEVMQKVLCVPMGEVGTVGATSAFHIAIFEETNLDPPSDNRRVKRDGKIDKNERDILLKYEDCADTKVNNFYERRQLNNGAITDISALIVRPLNNAKKNLPDLAGVPDLAENTTLAGARPQIKAVRKSIQTKFGAGAKLRNLPESMADQWTRDLFDAVNNVAAGRLR